MADSEKKDISKEQSEDLQKGNKKSSKILWFLFIIVIPFLFALVITVVVLEVAGIDVNSKAMNIASHIPYLSSYVKSKSSQKNVNTLTQLKEELVSTQRNLDETQKALKAIQDQVAQKDAQIKTLTAQNAALQQQQQTVQNQAAELERKKKLVLDTYTTMDAKKAAAIIKALPDNTAVSILSKIPSTLLSELFASMTPQDAAKYTKLLTTP